MEEIERVSGRPVSLLSTDFNWRNVIDRRAMEQIQKYGTMVKSPTGFPIQSPYLAIANRQAEIMMRIASEFGFTPASRSRISAPPPDQLPLFEEEEEQGS